MRIIKKGEKMKKVKTIICISILSISTMIAGSTCSYDFYGNWVCKGTDNDYGRGSTCAYDFYGNWVCR